MFEKKYMTSNKIRLQATEAKHLQTIKYTTEMAHIGWKQSIYGKNVSALEDVGADQFNV